MKKIIYIALIVFTLGSQLIAQTTIIFPVSNMARSNSFAHPYGAGGRDAMRHGDYLIWHGTVDKELKNHGVFLYDCETDKLKTYANDDVAEVKSIIDDKLFIISRDSDYNRDYFLLDPDTLEREEFFNEERRSYPAPNSVQYGEHITIGNKLRSVLNFGMGSANYGNPYQVVTVDISKETREEILFKIHPQGDEPYWDPERKGFISDKTFPNPQYSDMFGFTPDGITLLIGYPSVLGRANWGGYINVVDPETGVIKEVLKSIVSPTISQNFAHAQAYPLTNTLVMVTASGISNRNYFINSIDNEYIEEFVFKVTDGTKTYNVHTGSFLFSNDLTRAFVSGFIVDATPLRDYLLEKGVLFKETTATVTAGPLHVRRSAVLKDKILGALQAGETVTVLDRSSVKVQIGDMNDWWYKVRRESDGLEGWAYGGYLELTEYQGELLPKE